ncbi:MAG TPA: hypothetical protein VLI04_23290 [Nocardioidaceae bacterium]|nr:hypothetical protein [Nocardioidaceae bacterium]
MTVPRLVVEFCGLPGAGKTLLAEQTCIALRERGVAAEIADRPISAAVPKVARVRRRAGLAGGRLVRHPADTFGALRSVARTRPSLRDGAALLLQWLAVEGLAAAPNDDSFRLLEEGVVQTAWSLVLRAGPDALVGLQELVAEGTVSRRLIVLVDVPVELAVDRLRARASLHSRTQLLSPAEQRAELEVGSRLMRVLLDASPAPVLTIRNDGTSAPETLGAQIAEGVLQAR